MNAIEQAMADSNEIKQLRARVDNQAKLIINQRNQIEQLRRNPPKHKPSPQIIPDHELNDVPQLEYRIAFLQRKHAKLTTAYRGHQPKQRSQPGEMKFLMKWYPESYASDADRFANELYISNNRDLAPVPAP